MKISQMVTDLLGVEEFLKNNQRKLGKGEQLFCRATHRLYLIQIPIKLHEDIMNSE